MFIIIWCRNLQFIIFSLHKQNLSTPFDVDRFLFTALVTSNFRWARTETPIYYYFHKLDRVLLYSSNLSLLTRLLVNILTVMVIHPQTGNKIIYSLVEKSTWLYIFNGYATWSTLFSNKILLTADIAQYWKQL